MFSSLFAPQSRHSFFALHEKSFMTRILDDALLRVCMEQSWNNVRAKSLHFPTFARKHCSIDLRFSFARGAPSKKSCKARVTVG